MACFKKLWRLLRVSHWSKSLFVLLGVIYTDVSGYWPQALFAALAFCFTSSAVYIYNDLQDIEEDKKHPHKSRRPIASEAVLIPVAIGLFVISLIGGLCLAFWVSSSLAAILGVYLLINLIYNHWLRRVPVFDAICVASGFMLRILAGTIGIGLPLTAWLTTAVTLLSLFIALSKRRLEMQLSLNDSSSRAVLQKYHPRLLNSLLVFTAVSSFLTYLIYLVYAQPHSFYFILTLPFAGFGLWRFLSLLTIEHERDDPVFVLFSDSLSVLNLASFFILTLLALACY